MKLLAIDGNSIMNRAFYGIKLLSNSKGQFTNALTGFMNIYLKEIGEVKPDCVAVAFDLKAPTFRHKANAAVFMACSSFLSIMIISPCFLL